jgi:hypothetical protein
MAGLRETMYLHNSCLVAAPGELTELRIRLKVLRGRGMVPVDDVSRRTAEEKARRERRT